MDDIDNTVAHFKTSSYMHIRMTVPVEYLNHLPKLLVPLAAILTELLSMECGVETIPFNI